MILEREEKLSTTEAIRRFLAKNREENSFDLYDDWVKNKKYLNTFEKEEHET